MSLVLFDKYMDAVQSATSLEEAKAFSKAARMAMDENSYKTLILEEAPRKIETIKELREVFGYGLKEAKDKVETPNYEVGRFQYTEAMQLKSRFERVGCIVRVV